MKKKRKKILSKLLVVITIMTAVVQPVLAYADVKDETMLPTLEEVREQLEEDEIVTADDYEIPVGADYDITTDLTGVDGNEDKVNITYYEARNEAGEDFDIQKAGTYKVVYHVEPVNKEHPSYEISRHLIVREKKTPEKSAAETHVKSTSIDKVKDSKGEEDDLTEDSQSSKKKSESETQVVDEGDRDDAKGSESYQVDVTKGEEYDIVFNHEDGIYNAGEKVEFTADIPEGKLTAVAALKVASNQNIDTADLLYSEVTYHPDTDSFTFEMPNEDVALEVTEDHAEADIMLLADDTPWDEATEIEANTYYYYSDGTLHPFNTVMGSGGNDSYKYVRYKVNGKTYTVNAYCMQHSMSSPPSGTTYKKMVELDEGGDDKYLRKAFFYGYGGPGWGDTFNGYNIKKIMSDAGCTSEMRSMQHYLVDYLYDGESGFGGALSETAKTMLKDIKAALKKMPDPTATELLPGLSVKTDTTKTDTFTWKANEAFKITIHLEDGVSLVNETTGKTGTGDVTVKGGDKFHLVATTSNISDLKGKYSITSNYPLDFHAMLLKLESSQDIGFGYYTNSSDITLTVDWPEQAKIEIVKKDAQSNKNVAGAVYGIYSDSKCTKLITKMPETDDKGASSVTINKTQDTVYVKEISAPTGYVIDTKSYNVKLVVGSTPNSLIVSDKQVKGKIHVVKKDKETDTFTPQGDATMIGAVYGLYAKKDIVHPDGHTGVVYKAGTLVAKQAFGESGKITFTDLYLGEYYVKEISNPTGYLKDETEYPVTVSYKDQNTSVVEVETTVYETVKKQPFEIIKVSTDGSSTETQLVEGAEFTVKLESEVQKKGWEAAGVYDTLITDARGNALSIDLPYGTYHVKETKTPVNMNTTKDFYVTVTEDSRTPQIWRVMNDSPFTAYIRLIKKDVDTGEIVVLSGTTFKIRDLESGEDISMKVGSTYVSTFETDEAGMVTTPLKLQAGEYEVYEIIAPYGYVVRTEAIPFSVSSTGEYHTDDDGDFVVDVEIANKQQVGQLHLYKHGEKLIGIQSKGVIASIVTYVRELIGQDTQETLSFVYEDAPVEGAEFYLVVDETIYTADHQTDTEGNRRVETYEGVTLTTGTVAAILTTDSEGKAALENLPLGKYHLEEIIAGDGFVLNQTLDTFELSYGGQNVEVVTYDSDFENERVKASVSLIKNCQETNRPVEGAVYGIYTAEDVVTKEGETVVTKDTLVQQQSTDAEGKLTFSADLPLGKYYVKELTAAPGYLIEETIYDLDLTYQGQDVALIAESLAVTDQPIIVSIKKTDITTGDEIPGAHLQVTDESGNVYEEWDSTEEAHVIYGIPAGKYNLVETLAPDGYVTAKTVEFTVEETGEVQQVEMKDDYTKVKISKQNAKGKMLAGAKLTIKDSTGKKVESWTSTKKTHDIEKLPVGKYTLHEEAAPDGYEIAKDIAFEVKDTGDVQQVVMVDKKTPDPTPTPTATPSPTASPTSTAAPKAGTTTGSTTTTAQSVKTGDSTPIAWLFGLLLLGGLGTAAVAVYRKKRK